MRGNGNIVSCFSSLPVLPTILKRKNSETISRCILILYVISGCYWFAADGLSISYIQKYRQHSLRTGHGAFLIPFFKKTSHPLLQTTIIPGCTFLRHGWALVIFSIKKQEVAGYVRYSVRVSGEEQIEPPLKKTGFYQLEYLLFPGKKHKWKPDYRCSGTSSMKVGSLLLFKKNNDFEILLLTGGITGRPISPSPHVPYAIVYSFAPASRRMSAISGKLFLSASESAV